jgi:hypothetical protein
MPHRPRLQFSNYSEQTPTRQEMRRLAAAGGLNDAALDFLRPVKPAEELYDTDADPHEVHNLVADPEYQDVLSRMRGDLEQWMIQTGDTGLVPEAMLHERAGGASPYDMAADSDRFDPAQILAAAQLVGRGPESCGQMLELLKGRDPAARYWAAVGLAALGSDARPARAALSAALQDAAPDVRFCAAEALCHLGGEAEALPVLAAGLRDEAAVVRLYAAIAIVAVGRQAGLVAPQIRAALENKQAQGNYEQYTRWALTRALAQTESDADE